MDHFRAEDVWTEDVLANDLNALKTSFPDGVSEREYGILLKILYEEYSDRNLAELMARFTDKPFGKVYNDVLGANESNVSKQEMQAMYKRIKEMKTVRY